MTIIKNSYPELQEIAYLKTKIEMPDVVIFAKSLVGKYSKEAVRMAYAIFRFESANGSKGVNNNYAGIQADVGRWKNLPGNPVATCVKSDVANNMRRFLCFDKEDGHKITFELLCIKATERYIVTSMDYQKKWVGRTTPSQVALKNFQSVLTHAVVSIP